MSYSSVKLKTLADCEAAIAMAIERKTALIFSQTVQGNDLTNQEKVAASAAANLLVVKAQIGGVEAALVDVPEGKDKIKLGDQLRRLNDKKGNLEARLRDAGSAALLDTELDAGLLRAQVAEVDAYIAEMEARKAAL